MIKNSRCQNARTGMSPKIRGKGYYSICDSRCPCPRRPILRTNDVLCSMSGASFPVLRPWRCEILPGLLLRRYTRFAPATRPTKNSVPYWLVCCRPNPATHKQASLQKMATRRSRPPLVSSRLASPSHAICMRNCTKRRRFRPRRFRRGEGRRSIAWDTRLATCESYVALFNVVGLLYQSTLQQAWFLFFRGTRGRAPKRRFITPIVLDRIPCSLVASKVYTACCLFPLFPKNLLLLGMCNGDRWGPSGNIRDPAAYAKAAELGRKLSIGLETAYQVV